MSSADTSAFPTSALAIAQGVQSGQFSAVDVVQAALERTEAHQEEWGAYVHILREDALAQARAIDQKRAEGAKLGPLSGVPIGIKDAICMQGAPTTAGSKILQGDSGPWQAPYDATVIERLRAADAVFVGKCNMDEFAMGSSNENSGYFPAKNPHDTSRAPGGSSGGSAVSAAGGLTPLSLGSDTGGSIRQPAAFCGCVGLKPTYGRVSRYGLIAFASSLDQIGPMGTNVADVAACYEVIAGADPRDATCSEQALSAWKPPADPASSARRKIGYVPAFLEGLPEHLQENFKRTLAALEGAGHRVVEISLPNSRYAVAVYYILATAEASANLSRFDGIRFGLRKPAKKLTELYGNTRGAGFGQEVRRRIMLGTYVLSAGYYDAYYLKAQKVRTLLQKDFQQAFETVDAILCPTAPSVAFKLGENQADPLAMYLSDIYTLPASLAGVPALSQPGLPLPEDAPDSHLPVGLQWIAPAFEESRLFDLASEWETLLAGAKG